MAPREAEVVAGDGGVPAALALSFASPSPSDWSAFSPFSAPPPVFLVEGNVSVYYYKG